MRTKPSVLPNVSVPSLFPDPSQLLETTGNLERSRHRNSDHRSRIVELRQRAVETHSISSERAAGVLARCVSGDPGNVAPSIPPERNAEAGSTGMIQFILMDFCMNKAQRLKSAKDILPRHEGRSWLSAAPVGDGRSVEVLTSMVEIRVAALVDLLRRDFCAGTFHIVVSP
jgi:hypothetical protein